MRILEILPKRQVVCYLIISLIAPLAADAATPFSQQAGPKQQQSTVAPQGSAQDRKSEAATVTGDEAMPAPSYPDSPDATRSQAIDQAVSARSLQPTPESQQASDSQKPVGTAAAPYEKTSGVAASRPAGAVIAPAKQRRTRSILIKVGVIVAAGAALGTVVALSEGSSSRPH